MFGIPLKWTGSLGIIYFVVIYSLEVKNGALSVFICSPKWELIDWLSHD